MRAGVVLVSVCGENMLVATQKAQNYVPHITKINEDGAFYWKMMERHMSIPEMVKQAALKNGTEEKKEHLMLMKFWRKLIQKGYLVIKE